MPGQPITGRQRLAAEAGGDVLIEPVPVVPLGVVVPSPVLLQADRASAAVNAHARVVSRRQFM